MAMLVRRRPLLRAAAIGAGAYSAGKRRQDSARGAREARSVRVGFRIVGNRLRQQQ